MATTKKTDASQPQSLADAFKLPSLDDLTKMVQDLKLPNIDMNALTEWQRKDMEALMEANKQAYEGIQALAARRGEILRETLEQWQDALKKLPAGQDALASQTEAAQRGVKQAIANFQELTEMEIKARTNAWKVVQDRMQENMANLGNILQPKK